MYNGIWLKMKYLKHALLFALAMVSCKEQPSAVESTQVTMNLYYTGANGSARKFVEEMESNGTADAIRQEEGNLRYDYFFSAADPETVLLIDSWSSQEAIDAHHQTPMMQTIAAFRKKYDLHMTAERYHRAEQDLTTADESFIRK